MTRQAGPVARSLGDAASRELVFGDPDFERLAGLSNGHLHNLRRSPAYRAAHPVVEPTRASKVPIGQRRRPDPQGRPGFLRVDTVPARTASTLASSTG